MYKHRNTTPYVKDNELSFNYVYSSSCKGALKP